MSAPTGTSPRAHRSDGVWRGGEIRNGDWAAVFNIDEGRLTIARLGRAVVAYRGCFRPSLYVTVAAAGLLIGGGLAGALPITGLAAPSSLRRG